MTILRDNVFSQYLSTTYRLTIMVNSMVIPFHDYLSKTFLRVRIQANNEFLMSELRQLHLPGKFDISEA